MTKEAQVAEDTSNHVRSAAVLSDRQFGPEDPLIPAIVDEVAADLEDASAQEIVHWALNNFGNDLVLTSSFQDCVLIDIATRQDPLVEVIFLDTCYHFPETLAFVEQVSQRYEMNLRVISPDVRIDEWPCGTERCCEMRKVEPLRKALQGKRCWMTGLKRADSPSRANVPVVSFDAGKSVVKVNPLVTWSDDDVETYIRQMGLLRHPLTLAGYTSIGCAPTTTPVSLGAHPRSGRWSGTGKTECGLHL